MTLLHSRSLLALFYEALRWPGGRITLPFIHHPTEGRSTALSRRKEACL